MSKNPPRKLVDRQKQLMKQALDKLKAIDLVYTTFSTANTKTYCDERAAELKAEYADIMTRLIRETSEAIIKKQNLFV